MCRVLYQGADDEVGDVPQGKELCQPADCTFAWQR
jgi:hypothetical protein